MISRIGGRSLEIPFFFDLFSAIEEMRSSSFW